MYDNQPDPHDAPGFERATGIDDPTPRHEYRDEPPQHAPPSTTSTPTTTYTVHSRYGEAGTGFETDDPQLAEEYSRHGHRVTASTEAEQ